MDRFLITGLGNFPKEYEKTRHNVGRRVVSFFAKKEGWIFRKKANITGMMAKGAINEKEIMLFLPSTYMNLSGGPIQKCLKNHPVELSSMMIVVDDADLPLGGMLLKGEGGAGGHHGLESIRDHLQTLKFPRLRIGIGRKEYDLEKYVLESFSLEEEKMLDEVMEKAYEVLKLWVKQGIQHAMNVANIRKK